VSWRWLVLGIPVVVLAAATSCTNPFPRDPVPYDTSPWDSASDTAGDSDSD
jgi:hypothetical protein